MAQDETGFHCHQCGNCCARPEGLVRVSPEEIRRMAEYLGLTEAGFRSRYLTPDGTQLAEGLGGRCPFLVDGRTVRCALYPVRPEPCRTWPDWPELRQSARLRRAARRFCPGLGEDESAG